MSDSKVEWRVLPLATNTAHLNMATDEAVAEAIAAKQAKPTLRFYRWQPSAVSIGYFQSMRDEVDVDYCQQNGIDIVRRRTGGGAVYHDYNGEITYSIIGPEKLFPKDITKSYHAICGSIIAGLQGLGITAEFKPINDIVVGGKKISGNAQTRRNGVLLQHGTLLYDLDIVKMFTVLKVPKEKISDKMIQSVEERVTSLKKQANIDQQQAYEALLNGFTAGKEWKFGTLSEQELAKAAELAKTRYASDEWNFRR